MNAGKPEADEFEMLLAAYRGLPATIETPPAAADDPWSMPDHRTRNALALSVLQHRPFCAACQPHVDQAVLAAQGATVDELREMTP